MTDSVTTLEQFLKTIKVIAAIIVGLGGLLSYAFFIPRISVSPSTAPLNPDNPFATPFTLKNEGSLPIQNISAKVNMVRVTDAEGRGLQNIVLINSINNFPPLKSNRETSLDINPEFLVMGLKTPFNEAAIDIIVEFTSWPLSHRESFRFIMKQSTTGESNWYPTNN